MVEKKQKKSQITQIEEENEAPNPNRREPKTDKHPLSSRNFFRIFTFGWLNELIWVSKTTPWTQEMNYKLPKYDLIKNHKDKIQNTFRKRKNIQSTLISCYLLELIIYQIGSLAFTVLTSLASKQSASAGALVNTNTIYQNKKALTKFFFYLGLSELFSYLGKSTIGLFLFRIARVGIAARSAFYSILQDKIMRFSPLNSTDVKEGFIANLIQVDAVNLGSYLPTFASVVSGFVSTGVSLYFMFTSFGWQLSFSFVGISLFIRVIYLMIFSGINRIQGQYLKAKDARMSLLRNVLENAEYIKINGLETYFCLELYERRETELRELRKISVVMSFFLFLNGVLSQAPSLIIILLIAYCFGKGIGDQNYLFFLQLGTNLNASLIGLFYTIKYFVTYRVSMKRIDSFLLLREIDKNNVRKIKSDDVEVAIEIKRGNFKWRFSAEEEGLGLDAPTRKRLSTNYLSKEVSSPTTFTESLLTAKQSSMTVSSINTGEDQLEYGKDDDDEEAEVNQFYIRHVNLAIKKGEKIVILGKSCSGRSSLLYSMMGEMIPMNEEASVIVKGSIAYLSQNRWLLGMSVKDNITLGKEYDEEWMNEALRCSQLVKDLDTFSEGLETVLGDNGDTVSGGQRARIALARCFYQE